MISCLIVLAMLVEGERSFLSKLECLDDNGREVFSFPNYAGCGSSALLHGLRGFYFLLVPAWGPPSLLGQDLALFLEK